MPLTEQLLDRLDTCWRDQGVPWAASLRPGLTDAALDAIGERIGFELPADLRVWWAWRDGVGDGDPVSISAALKYASSGYALGIYDAMCATCGPQTLGCIPVLHTQKPSVFAADCMTAGPVPHIRYFEAALGGTPSGGIAAASLASAVYRLCEAYDTGLERWNRVTGRWDSGRGAPHSTSEHPFDAAMAL